jgi:hypothetical protein
MKWSRTRTGKCEMLFLEDSSKHSDISDLSVQSFVERTLLPLYKKMKL